MPKEKFDLDRYLDSIDNQEIPDFEETGRFVSCPRCGSDTWDKLYTTKKGKPSHCNECKDEHGQ